MLAEVSRTLKPNGFFVGYISQLEPYHSFSIWNFTIFDFKLLCDKSGLELLELMPGIDCITLAERSYHGRPKSYSKWFSEKPFSNVETSNHATSKGRSSGQFVF